MPAYEFPEASGVVGIGVVGIMIVGLREELPALHGEWFTDGRGVIWDAAGGGEKLEASWFVDARGVVWDASKLNRGRVWIADQRGLVWNADQDI